MKIYKDKNLTQEIKDKADFGIVPAGETKRFKFWVLNDSSAKLIGLVFVVEHKELKIIEFPEELHSNSIGELLIEWSPSVTLKQGLRATLKVNGKELWG